MLQINLPSNSQATILPFWFHCVSEKWKQCWRFTMLLYYKKILILFLTLSVVSYKNGWKMSYTFIRVITFFRKCEVIQCGLGEVLTAHKFFLNILKSVLQYSFIACSIFIKSMLNSSNCKLQNWILERVERLWRGDESTETYFASKIPIWERVEFFSHPNYLDRM